MHKTLKAVSTLDLSVQSLRLGSFLYNIGFSLALLVTTSVYPPAGWGPSSLPTRKPQASKPFYLSQLGSPSSPGSADTGPSSLLGGSHPSPNSPNPALTVISVPRAQCEGSRREGWLPRQQRIKPLFCQSADWLRHVPPPTILRVGGRGKGLDGQGEVPVCLASTGLPPPGPVRAPRARGAQSPTGDTGLALPLPPAPTAAADGSVSGDSSCDSLQANAELLRLRWCAQHRAPLDRHRQGMRWVCGHLGEGKGAPANGLGGRKLGSTALNPHTVLDGTLARMGLENSL